MSALTLTNSDFTAVKFLILISNFNDWLLASFGNQLLLSQSMPGPRQVTFWDKVLVRYSTIVDPLVRYTLGKSVLSVWSRLCAAQAAQGGSPITYHAASHGR